jgi:hypothetical protein
MSDPTLDPADVDHGEHWPLAVGPHEPFRAGRDELAVQPGDRTFVVDVDDGVVERARRAPLRDPERDPGRAVAGCVADRIERWPIDLHGLIGEPPVPLGVVPRLLSPDPVGIARNERFSEHHEVATVGSGGAHLSGCGFDGRVAVEVDGCGLDRRHPETVSTPHRVAPAMTSSQGPTNPVSVSNCPSASSISAHTDRCSSELKEPSIWWSAPKDSRSKRAHSVAEGS